MTQSRFGNRSRNPGGQLIRVIVMIALIVVVYQAFFKDRGGKSGKTSPSPTESQTAPPMPIRTEIVNRLRPPAGIEARDGIAAAILVDTSGSMSHSVKSAQGGHEPKISIARTSAVELVRMTEQFAKEHPDRRVLLGIYEFSGRGGPDLCRKIVPLSAPSVATAQPLIDKMQAEGNTPIGDAMITAKNDLDASGMLRQHLLVITDGENTSGPLPGDVAAAIFNSPDLNPAGVYFVAFDVNAAKFAPVRDAGGTVLSASNEQELKDTLGTILTGRILVE
jgi:Mg-chelatase subunit ChlD